MATIVKIPSVKTSLERSVVVAETIEGAPQLLKRNNHI